MEAAQEKFSEIIKRSIKYQVSMTQLARVTSCNAKLTDKFDHNKKFNLLALLILFISIAFVTTKCLDFRYDDKCWLAMPRELVKAFRYPEQCTICDGLKTVARLSKISPKDFEEIYAYSGIPVIVTDATENWTAVTSFNFRFFKKLYMSIDTESTSRDCQFFPYQTEFLDLADALNMSNDRAELKPGTDPWYIGWSNCHDKAAKILRQHYSRPYFLPESSENNAVDWIFMGGPGPGAQLHVDNVKYPSWQAQIKGLKRWTLVPPPECYMQCNQLQVVINPGEIIVLDTNRWYHKTEIIPGDVSMTIGAEFD